MCVRACCDWSLGNPRGGDAVYRIATGGRHGSHIFLLLTWYNTNQPHAGLHDHRPPARAAREPQQHAGAHQAREPLPPPRHHFTPAGPMVRVLVATWRELREIAYVSQERLHHMIVLSQSCQQTQGGLRAGLVGDDADGEGPALVRGGGEGKLFTQRTWHGLGDGGVCLLTLLCVSVSVWLCSTTD